MPPSHKTSRTKTKQPNTGQVIGNAQESSEFSSKEDLENDLQDQKNERKEERFLWIVLCIILVDIYVFSHIQNWAGALVIGFLELILIVIFAKKCEVGEVLPLIDRLAGFTKKTKD